MGKSKFGTFIILGAILGGAASLLDRTTREKLVDKSQKTVHYMQYYMQNKDELKLKVDEQKEKYEMILEKVSGDFAYIKEKVEEIQQVTPQIKELVADTKEALIESQDEFKAIAADVEREELSSKP